jgi:hypothetical protein
MPHVVLFIGYRQVISEIVADAKLVCSLLFYSIDFEMDIECIRLGIYATPRFREAVGSEQYSEQPRPKHCSGIEYL